SKWVRALVGGEVIADTTRPLLVWEVPYYPLYYFPLDDVRADRLHDTGDVKHSPSRGDAHLLDIHGGRGIVREKAAARYDDSPVEQLRATVRFEWDAMDTWLEENEPVHVHPHDPYKRIDILGSSRHVRIEVEGVTIADSTQPRVLYETSLPPRYYLPICDVRLDLLEPSATVTGCAYKGFAHHWTVVLDGERTRRDVAWTYWTPLPEATKIAGLICFYDEKVDVHLDGELQERPRTHFS
ncbi:MAG: DUF427 domain-containing protein, partial [Actinobacteria bacterium]|nr:DUF427 domain-containing protein [Actinomycetota bacterium]